ncbi:DUF3566 domain-containing protein [Corynebacterium kroppenstedtii]|uniref:DUF3566 domain-containing protein n=1 Tax=Corynebacterium kroppenstedtii TaxID=161879 RepID=UPI0038735B2B
MTGPGPHGLTPRGKRSDQADQTLDMRPWTGNLADGTAAGPASSAPAPQGERVVEVTHIDLHRAARISGAVSAIIALVWILAALLMFGLLAGMGAWGNMNDALNDVADTSVPTSTVIIAIIALAVFEAIIGTLLGVVAAAIYNGLARMSAVGGVRMVIRD